MDKQQRLIRKAINFDEVLNQIFKDIDSNNIENNDKDILFRNLFNQFKDKNYPELFSN